MGLIVRGTSYYVRLNVPKVLQGIVGKKEFIRSLRTGILSEAVRKARLVGAEFEQWLATGIVPGAGQPTPPAPAVSSFPSQKPAGKSLREVMDIFLTDPTKNRSVKATSYYLNAVEVAEAVIGTKTPISEISRQSCRDVVELLKTMPSNAKKLFPDLDYKQAAAQGKTGKYRLVGPKTLNDYLTKLSTLMNFAIDEGLTERNPFKGLKVEDEVHPRDKRHPFTNKQLRQMFDAPLYRGCVNDEDGYDQPGTAHPRRGRFWVPLIALYSGMRLNEICQLDLADVKPIGGVECFVITTETSRGPKDRLRLLVTCMSLRRVHGNRLEREASAE